MDSSSDVISQYRIDYGPDGAFSSVHHRNVSFRKELTRESNTVTSVINLREAGAEITIHIRAVNGSQISEPLVASITFSNFSKCAGDVQHDFPSIGPLIKRKRDRLSIDLKLRFSLSF
eukprot:m.284651 g.284651  ORF g.284651 m.284651 type:complete len:118 (+) comp40680_c0_seq24:1170-1523(+)